MKSLAGRDQGTSYVVLRQVDERRVAVCNGRRAVDRPKLKNRRHLEILGWVETNLALRLERGDRVSDMDIMKALQAWLPRVMEEV